MGRKLTPIEAEAFTDGDASPSAGEAGRPSPHGLVRQAQIAQALGLPVAALRRSGDVRTDMPDTVALTQMTQLAMIRDCLDLVQAYASITDPEERQRLLRIVREVAERR